MRRLELIAGCLSIVAIRHSMNHNYKSSIWQLRHVTSCYFASAVTKIHCRSLVASLSNLPRLPNVARTFLHNNFNLVSPIPFSSIAIFDRQPSLDCLQIVCNLTLRVQGSISQLFKTGLSPYNGPMLLFKKPSHPYFLPIVESTKVGLPNPSCKIASRGMQFVSSSLELCLWHTPSLRNHRSHNLHCRCQSKSLAMGANWKSRQQRSSAVPQPAEIVSLGG
jgi:hypothetical protein